MSKRFFFRHLLSYLVTMMTPLLLLGSLTLVLTWQSVRDYITQENVALVNLEQEYVDQAIRDLRVINESFDVYSDVGLRLEELFDNQQMTYSRYVSRQLIETLFNAHINEHGYVYSTYVYYLGKSALLSSKGGFSPVKGFYDTQWIQEVEQEERSTWARRRLIRQNGKTIAVVSLFDKSKFNCVVVHNIRVEYFSKLMDSLCTWEGQKSAIVNEDGCILFTSGEAEKYIDAFKAAAADGMEDGIFKYDGIRYLVHQSTSLENNWRYLSMVPTREAFSLCYSIWRTILILMAGSLLVGLFLTWRATRKNTRSIQEIIRILDDSPFGPAASDGPSKKLLGKVQEDEYEQIVEGILRNFMEKKYLQVQLSERKYRLSTMELLALQSQINPHFLFNTLEAINWKTISLTNGPNQATAMISDLSKILRYSLTDPREKVLLSEEITYTQYYINIQLARYNYKFKVVWNYDEELLNVQIMKLLLQPLIENCIQHGLRGKNENGRISIRIQREGDRIHLVISDNGIGIEAEKLAVIRQRLLEQDDEKVAESKHIGLFNASRRLQLTYGEKCCLQIQSVEGSGTSIFISIPLTEELEETDSEPEGEKQ